MVKNRSQKQINDGMTLLSAREAENDFFSGSCQIYRYFYYYKMVF